MPNPNVCLNCKGVIPPDAPGGLCPACLLLGAAGPTVSPPGALASAPSVEEVRTAFPELEVSELVGHGGMGVIFKTRQPLLDRTVALKILPPALAQQPGFAERFTREARALARLSHPNIVAVYDFGSRGTFPYLMMEFVHGVNLRQAMRSGITPEQALGLVPRICEALQFAHDRGVLHRDIKPENILLDTNGTPKLADFGIAKLAEDKVGQTHGLTLSGAALGTAAYMAPEQIEKPGGVDHRADIYSLGVVLYEMLTGELPLGRFAAPSEKAKVTAGVDEVVFRALEKERERRQQSAREMKTQVEHATAAGGRGGDASFGPQRVVGGGALEGAGINSELGGSRWTSKAPLFVLFLAILTALLIPFAATGHGVRRYVSPVTLSCLAAVFGAIFALWPVFFPGRPRVAGPAGAASAQGSRWWVPVTFGLLSLPLAVYVALLAAPAMQAQGHSPLLGVMFGVAVMLVFAIYASVIAAVFRGLVRTGAPRWVAVVLAGFLALLAIPGGCGWIYLTAERSNPIPPWPQKISSYATSPAMSTVTAERAPFIGEWPEGTVELVAVTKHPSDDAPWWRMDGLQAKEGPFINPGDSIEVRPDEEAFEFYLRTRGLPKGASGPEWLVENAIGWTTGAIPALASAPNERLSGYHVITARFPKGQLRTGIKAGLAYESWKTLSTSRPNNFIEYSEHHEGLEWRITHGTAHEKKGGGITVTFTASRHPDWESRVVAVRREDGQEVATTRVSILNDQSEWHFPNLSLESAEELRFQVRRIRWIDFQQIRLQQVMP